MLFDGSNLVETCSCSERIQFYFFSTPASKNNIRISLNDFSGSLRPSDFMRECLLQMRLSAAAQDWPKELIAYTDDRMAFFEGRGQLYGTNADWQDGELKPTLIEDPDHLEYRRKSMGLPPMRKDIITNERPPRDAEKKQKEFEIWLKKTGWRP